MAKQPSQDEFLGGKLTFNQVGSAPAASEEAAAPPAAPHRPLRTLIIVAVVVLLALLLYWVSDNSIGGITHTGGHGGVSPTDRPTGPPQNF